LGDERRDGDRPAIELSVEYKRLNAFFADYTKNISRGGTFIKTDKPLPIGTEFIFKLSAPGASEPLALRGRVQWVMTEADAKAQGQDPGMGIGFIYASEDERERVIAIVEALMVKSLGSVIYEKLVGQKRNRE
jgi:type IV pilus assembly protein PilZ